MKYLYLSIYLLKLLPALSDGHNEKTYFISSTNHHLSFEHKVVDIYCVVSKIKLQQKSAREIQEFAVNGFKGVSLKAKIPFNLIDLNGDGFEDISLLLQSGPSYANYLYLIYSPSSKQYKKLGVFPLLNKTNTPGILKAETRGGEAREIIEAYYHFQGDQLILRSK